MWLKKNLKSGRMPLGAQCHAGGREFDPLRRGDFYLNAEHRTLNPKHLYETWNDE
jgi:hypothetical protein